MIDLKDDCLDSHEINCKYCAVKLQTVYYSSSHLLPNFDLLPANGHGSV